MPAEGADRVRALIVDDEPTVRLLLSRILRREVECAVSEATNGIEALDLLARHHYDFVVLDLMMPIMNGLETLEAIRTMPALRSLPVMVLSSVRDEAQVRQVIRLGVSAYLTKPLRPSDATARIQRFVSRVETAVHATQAHAARSLGGFERGARLLVVDGDSDYRQFVRSTIGHEYTVGEAETGAQGLRACLDVRPAAILLGQNLGAVTPAMFLRKLRSLPSLATVPVIVATARPSDAVPVDADATLQRSFVPETFRRQFSRLVAGGAPEQKVLLARPHLRPQMISATEQVFGMMLGIEVFADAEDPIVPDAETDVARVPLRLPQEDSDLEFGILATREMGEQMTALFLQGMEVVSDEDVQATLQEISNIITGRLQNALRERGDEAAIGLPEVGRVGAHLNLPEQWAAVGFQNASGDVRFTTYVRPMSRAAAA
jgi:CheY-like chemotaxis protein